LSQYLSEIIKRKTGQDQPAAEAFGRNIDLSRINLDSIDIMALSHFIHRKYHRKIPITTLFLTALTVRQVADAIMESPNSVHTSKLSHNVALSDGDSSTSTWWRKVKEAVNEVRQLTGTGGPSMDHKQGSMVFLTGATGYL